MISTLFGNMEEDSRQAEHTHFYQHPHYHPVLQRCKKLFSKYLSTFVKLFTAVLTIWSYSILNDCKLSDP